MKQNVTDGEVKVGILRWVLFLLVSSVLLALSIYFTGTTSKTLFYSGAVGIGLFLLLLKLHKGSPMKYLVPAPKTTLHRMVLLLFIVFYIYPARQFEWTYVGLAGALVGISIYGLIRTVISARSNGKTSQ